MVYFDNASTTRVDEEVASEIVKTMCENFGNPSSLHGLGLSAQLAFERAADGVKAALGATEGQVVFTSGGTEANNLAIFGAASVQKKRGNRVIVSAVEHSSVIAPFAELKRQGFEVCILPCDKWGRVSPEELAALLTPDTILVSVMLVNNEVGTLQPLPELVRLTRLHSPLALFHCDGVQSLGKIPLAVAKWDIDLFSVSGHKIHAPKGIGALYIKKGVRILAQIFGGGQQNALKPGTESVPLAVGMGLAAQRAKEQLTQNREHVLGVRQHLLDCLQELEGVAILSPMQDVSPFILCLSVAGYKSETLLHALESQEVYVSAGSACGKGAKSPVLTAMGCADRIIDSAIRVSLCKTSTIDDADKFIVALQDAMGRLKKSR